jgi:hypothetical protein
MKAKLITADLLDFEIEIPNKEAPTEIRRFIRRRSASARPEEYATALTELCPVRTYLLRSYQDGVPVYEEEVQKYWDVNVIQEAFTLGFMVTREGFCSESMFDHHAPPCLQPATGTEAQFKEDWSQNPEFLRLRELAVQRIMGAKSF